MNAESCRAVLRRRELCPARSAVLDGPSAPACWSTDQHRPSTWARTTRSTSSTPGTTRSPVGWPVCGWIPPPARGISQVDLVRATRAGWCSRSEHAVVSRSHCGRSRVRPTWASKPRVGRPTSRSHAPEGRHRGRPSNSRRVYMSLRRFADPRQPHRRRRPPCWSRLRRPGERLGGDPGWLAVPAGVSEDPERPGLMVFVGDSEDSRLIDTIARAARRNRMPRPPHARAGLDCFREPVLAMDLLFCRGTVASTARAGARCSPPVCESSPGGDPPVSYLSDPRSCRSWMHRACPRFGGRRSPQPSAPRLAPVAAEAGREGLVPRAASATSAVLGAYDRLVGG